MGKRTKLFSPGFSCDLSVVRFNAFIEYTLSVVRESVGGMLDGGVCVVAFGTGVSIRTVSLAVFCLTLMNVEPMTNLYGVLFGRVPHFTCLLALTCTLEVLYGMLMGGIGVCTFWCH